MPLGALLDQWEVYRQLQGIAYRKGNIFIDELIQI